MCPADSGYAFNSDHMNKLMHKHLDKTMNSDILKQVQIQMMFLSFIYTVTMVLIFLFWP